MRSCSFATFEVRSVGTLVRSETALKDTRVISGGGEDLACNKGREL